MAQTDSMTLGDIAHLLTAPFPTCPNCEHLHLSHWYELGPSGCKVIGCACTWDPKCETCGALTSQHTIPEEPGDNG